MGIFNNTSYTNNEGKTVPAKIDVKYKKPGFFGIPVSTNNPALATDTIVTLTPDASGATTQRITLSGADSHSEHLDNAGEWVPSAYQPYWIPRGREAYNNKGNQPTPWQQFKNKIGIKQQGGTMNRIKYFQQGGQQAAPQQSAQSEDEQLIAVVQAAMQGDQEATQTVNQILKAAKAGDPKAQQYAQKIQQIVEAIKQKQGQQTPVKRYGSKLNYIRSLKYANGGKTCPSCQKGGMPVTSDKAYTKSNKKVEEKACGGKAKKRYFGGWL